MRIACVGIGLGLVTLAVGALLAQPPTEGRRNRNGRDAGDAVEAALARLMTFDANGDGKLSKAELTDVRLEPLFERADSNKDGTATRDELSAVLSRDAAELPPPREGDGPPDGPPGRRGGAFGRGPGGRGPGRAFHPGQLLPQPLQDELKLTDEQRQKIDELQKETDSRLAKILTEDQQRQLREIRERGPGDFGPPSERGPREGGRPGGPRRRRAPPDDRPRQPQP